LNYVSRRALTGEARLVEAMASVDAGLGVLALIFTVERKCKLEVCMGPGLAEEPRRDPAYGSVGPGPGRTDNVRIEAGFGPGPNDSNQTFF
jgi:hypothetical protein